MTEIGPVIDRESAEKEINELRERIRHTEAESQNVPELNLIKEANIPENQNILTNAKYLHSKYVINELLNLMD